MVAVVSAVPSSQEHPMAVVLEPFLTGRSEPGTPDGHFPFKRR